MVTNKEKVVKPKYLVFYKLKDEKTQEFHDTFSFIDKSLIQSEELMELTYLEAITEILLKNFKDTGIKFIEVLQVNDLTELFRIGDVKDE